MVENVALRLRINYQRDSPQKKNPEFTFFTIFFIQIVCLRTTSVCGHTQMKSGNHSVWESIIKGIHHKKKESGIYIFHDFFRHHCLLNRRGRGNTASHRDFPYHIRRVFEHSRKRYKVAPSTSPLITPGIYIIFIKTQKATKKTFYL